MEAHVGVAHVVADDEQDVGFGGQVLSPGEMTTWNVKRCQRGGGWFSLFVIASDSRWMPAHDREGVGVPHRDPLFLNSDGRTAFQRP